MLIKTNVSEKDITEIPETLLEKWSRQKFVVRLPEFYKDLRRFFSHEEILDIEPEFLMIAIDSYLKKNNHNPVDITLILNHKNYIDVINADLYSTLANPKKWEIGWFLSHAVNPPITDLHEIDTRDIPYLLSVFDLITYDDIKFEEMYIYSTLKNYLIACYVDNDILFPDYRFGDEFVTLLWDEFDFKHYWKGKTEEDVIKLLGILYSELIKFIKKHKSNVKNIDSYIDELLNSITDQNFKHTLEYNAHMFIESQLTMFLI